MVGIGTIVVGFVLILGLLLSGLHVASVMILTALIGVLYGFGPAILAPLGNMMWGELNSFILTAIPLYILMGEILVHSEVAQRMYRSLSDWLTWLPGGLLHTNVVSSTVFAAISGSSVATAATIGTVAFPTFRMNQRISSLPPGVRKGPGRGNSATPRASPSPEMKSLSRMRAMAGFRSLIWTVVSCGRLDSQGRAGASLAVR